MSANPVTKGAGQATITGILPFAKEYPARLHIDINDGYRGQDLGRKLIEALVQHLKENNVKGLLLQAAADNENAIGFCRSLGFEQIGIDKNEYTFGMKPDK